MKSKILMLLICVCSMFLIGCDKTSDKDIYKKLTKKIEESKSYHVVGELEIINNEDSYLYDVDVAYEKDDKFRVSLKNKTNNHEQIILKNMDGVYVLTPSLNKSFKFQSEWPYNNSQAYLLQTLLSDLKKDTTKSFTKNEEGYVISSKVNYSNSKDLIKQNIYLDKDLNVKEVHVLNENDIVQMKMKFTEIDLKAVYDNNYFNLKSNVTVFGEENLMETSQNIDTIIYPMYIPENTHLSGQDKITKIDGERIILTFSGDKPFMFIQETVKTSDDILTIPVYGQPEIISDTVGTLTDTSVNWVSNGIEYYVVSDVLSESELLSVAKSISVMPVGK